MSDLSDTARVQIFLADHAVVDPANKINALGIGYQYTVVNSGGFTAACAVVVIAEFPVSAVGEEFALELALYNNANELVTAPGLMGDATTPVRFAQNVTLEQPQAQLAGLRIPRDAFWARHHLVAAFQNGLPLAVGMSYEWRVAIDTVTRPDWASGFYVPAPVGGVVVG